MVLPLRQLAIYAARKIAANPEARDKAIEVARQVSEETRKIARDPSPARAAGRAARRYGDQLRRRFLPDDQDK